MFYRSTSILIVSLIIVGCSSGGDGSPDFTNQPDPYVGSLAKNYVANNPTATLTGCTNPSDDGLVTFDSATYAIDSGNDQSHAGTAIFTITDGNTVLKLTLNTTGSIDNQGNITGTALNTSTINGVIDSTGDGTYNGTLSGNNLVINYDIQNLTGDTCRAVGSVDFVAVNPGGGAGPISGSFNIASLDLLLGSFTPTGGQTASLGGLQIYSVNTDPEGFPETFTPDHDIFTLAVNTTPNGQIISVALSYFNTGSDPTVLPDSYLWELPCDTALACNTVTVTDTSIQLLSTELPIQISPDPNITNLAVDTLTISGSASY